MSVAIARNEDAGHLSAPIPANETERLEALYQYNILNTVPDEELDNITRLASFVCGMPISVITLLDRDTQWFKSKQGISGTHTSRDQALCSYAIMNPGQSMVVPSLLEDNRFHFHPMLEGDVRVMSYIGVPLVNPDGYPLGTLCVVDSKPNYLSDEQIEALETLARQVMFQFELHKRNRELAENQRMLEAAYEDIEQFSRIVAHDLKSPVANVYTLSQLLLEALEGSDNARLAEQARMLYQSSNEMSRMIDGVLQYAKSSHIEKGQKGLIDLENLVDDLCDLVGIPPDTVTVSQACPVITSYRTPLQHILLNLLVNAMKYGDKPVTRVRIDCEENAHSYTIRVSDNGPGMSEEIQARAFDLFYSGDQRGTYGEGPRNHGIGLATVRTLVGKLKGTIRIESSVLGKGTTFAFTIAK